MTSVRKGSSDLAVTKHLKDNPDCVAEERRELFHSGASQKQSTPGCLGSAIYKKKLAPVLCLQELTHVLELFHLAWLVFPCARLLSGAFGVNIGVSVFTAR